MGFLGDMFSDMLNEAGAEIPVSTRFRKNDRNFVQFYQMIYIDFGLTSKHRLQENERVPVRVSNGFDDKPYAFEIHGTIHHPSFFLTRGGILDKLARELPISQRRAWAFDITRLNEGILKGQSVFPGDAAFAQSEESLKILRIIHAGMRTTLSHVPGVTLEFGDIWTRFGVPDTIHFIVNSLHPFNDAEFLRVVDLISHNYRNYNVPVNFSYSGNPATGTMSLTAIENVPEPVVPPTPQQPDGPGAYARMADFMADLNSVVENQPHPPTDNFPYDFYRGLGLIDSEDMVTMPSVLGPVRVDMTNDLAKAHLLSYKPEN